MIKGINEKPYPFHFDKSDTKPLNHGDTIIARYVNIESLGGRDMMQTQDGYYANWKKGNFIFPNHK